MTGRRNGLKATICLLLLLSLALCFFACKPNDGGNGGNVNVIEPEKPTGLVYTVDFVSNGGSSVSSLTARNGEKIKQPAAPVKKGYTFVGWYTAPETFVEWDFAKDEVTSNVTLYAKWRLTDDVFVEDDNFSYSPSTRECVYTVAATEENLDLTGKILLAGENDRYYFYYDEECTSPVGGETFELVPGKNVYYMKVTDSATNTLYVARFVINRGKYFTVTFYDEKGGKVGEKICEEGKTLASAPEEYFLIGYDILWYDGTKEFRFGDNGTVVHSDVTLRALTKVKSYSVVFNADGGTVSVTAQRVEYGKRVVLPAATKSGYGFKGWFTQDGTQVCGNNGIVEAWNIPSDTTLIARWDGNAVEFTYELTLNGATVASNVKSVASGDRTTLNATGRYDGIVNDGNGNYTIYVFGGFCSSDGTVLSAARTFTTEPVTGKTKIIEKWFTFTVAERNLNGETEAARQTITFDGGEKLRRYGNLDAGDKIKATVICCECGKHTFEGWNGLRNGITEAEFTLRSESVSYTEWNAFTIKITNEIKNKTTAEELDGAFSGDGMEKRGENAKITAVPQDKYTFVGWFDREEKISGALKFDYEFIVTESKEFKAVWTETDKLFEIKGDDKVSVEVNVKKENNVVGGTAAFVPKIADGYVFTGLYAEDGTTAATDGKELFAKLPEEGKEYEVRYELNKIKISSNAFDSGAIIYRVGTGAYRTGTSYGGTFTFGGMTQGDNVVVEAETYDGYVWLGWYKNGKIYTTETCLRFGADATAEDEYEANWKKAVYSVNVSSGVFSSVETGSQLPAGKYYSYDETAGTFTLCPAGAADKTKTYYSYAENATNGGKQYVSSYRTSTETGEFVTLSATVNDGYRFDGWYDENDDLITFDLSFTFSVRRLKSGYEAKYTKIDEDKYEIKVSAYNGTVSEPAPKAGTVGFYAYKTVISGVVTEYCKITVKTNKNAVGESGELRGYNYLGLYPASSDAEWTAVINTSPLGVQTRTQEQIAAFEFTYLVNVAELRKTESTKSYLAVWRKGKVTDYYVTAEIVNENSAAGDAYYMAYGGRIILVAEPKTGYVFAGWETAAGTTHEYVWETGNDGSGQSYKAKWTAINESGNNAKINVKYATGNPGGTYATTALTNDKNDDEFVLSAITNDGFVFLGWYATFKTDLSAANAGAATETKNALVYLGEKFSLTRTFVKYPDPQNDGEYITYKAVAFFSEETGETVYLVSDEFEFEPRWRKTDASIQVDSVGESEITGFTVYEDGKNTTYYRIRIRSDIEYGINGAAWYGGKFFDGWYDEDGEKISGDYEIIVREDNLRGYYKAVWSELNVNVEITSNGESSGGSTATYAFYLDGKNLHVIFMATCADGYYFMGWEDETTSPGTIKSYNLAYDLNLGEFDREKEYDYAFRAMFGRISDADKPGARYEEESGTPASPSINGVLRSEDGQQYFTVTAKKIKGYAFLGWKYKSDLTSTDKYVSRDMTYSYGAEDTSESLTAVYKQINYIDGYTEFITETNKKFAEYVNYYGYYTSEGTLVIEVEVDIPDGYGYRVVTKSGEIIPSSIDRPELVTVKSGTREIYNGLIVEFFRASETAGRFVEIERSTDNIGFEYVGYVRKTTGYATAYDERWTLKTTFDKNGYSFIGWFDNMDNLLEITDEYVVDAPETSRSVNMKFGKYSILVENENETAGDAYVEGYDVTFSFDLNTTEESIIKGVGDIPSQLLNAGDKIEYPYNVLHKNVGAFMFGGWFDNPECEGKEYDFNKDIKRDVKVYAKWIPMSDYGADETNAIYADGKYRIFNVTEEKKDYYFVATINGKYTLTVNNYSNNQRTEILVGEASGDVTNEYVVNDTAGKTFTFAVEKSKAYKLSLRAKGTENSVQITLKAPEISISGRRSPLAPYGGSVKAVAVPKDYSDSERTDEAYVFEGWYCNGVLVTDSQTVNGDGDKKYVIYPEVCEIVSADYSKYADMFGNIELVAKWKKLTLDVVTSDADGGNMSYTLRVVERESEYTENVGAKYWALGAVAATNYTFVGWYLYDKTTEQFADEPLSREISYNYIIYDGDDAPIIKCEWKYTGNDGLYNITYSMNTTDAVNSPYNMASFNAASTTEILLYNPHKYYKENGEIKGYYVFEGWFTDKEYTKPIEKIIPQNYKGNVTVYAKWGKAVKNVSVLTDADGSKYFYLGVYPQTAITDETFIRQLGYDNNVYADANDYRNEYRYYSYDDGSRYYKISDTLCYRVDPIRWNVVSTSDGSSYAVSACVLDYSEFSVTTNKNGEFYANNWEKSKLNGIMTSTFTKSHFTEIEKNFIALADMTVSNALGSGYYKDKDLKWAVQNDTSGYLFVPSYAESAALGGSIRKPVYSDYALYQKGTDGANGYWLRSWGDKENKAMFVNDDGEFMSDVVTTKRGVRLAVKINEEYCAK